MRNRILLLRTIIAGLILVTFSCKNTLPDFPYNPRPEPPGQVKPVPVEISQEIESKLVSANTNFGFKLFNQIDAQGGSGNIFISPTSIAIALAMTYNGAGGETKEAMTKALELQGMSLEEINGANVALKKTLTNLDPKVQLSIANSLWARKGVQFKQDFIQRNKDFYAARVSELDFNNPKASKTINKWVSDNTKRKILKIVEGQIDAYTILFLINAVYFKGDWTVKFDKSQTSEQDFYLPDGRQKKHPMMYQSGRYRYYKGDSFQAASLPYGDGKVSMYVFLPDKGSSLAEFKKKLSAENWEKWMSGFAMTKGDITMPKFKLEYSETLNKALSKLGMEIAFSPKANFHNMADLSGIYIYEVLHKTFVDVNEEGTEAAAVTKVEMRTTSAQPPEPTFSMVVDRPFFFAIRDNQTGTVLFMGSIMEPQL